MERSFAWMSRLRRLARDYERWPETIADMYLLGFAILMLHHAAALSPVHNSF